MTQILPAVHEADAASPDPILAALQSLMQGDISVMITNAAGVIEFVNPAFERHSGYSSREIIGQTPGLLDSGTHTPDFFASLGNAIRSGSVFRAVFTQRHKSGAVYHEDKMITPIRDAQSAISHYLSTGHLLGGRRTAAPSLPLPTNDALATRPDRRRFIARLGEAILRNQRDARRFALLYIDLDHFRRINDTLGHDTGDRVLAAVAQRIAEQVGDKDAITHLGGDEFTIILEQADSGKAADRLAQSLISRCSLPIAVDERGLHAAVSIGIAAYPDDGDSVDALMRHAEIAMYHAKSSGRNRYVNFHTDMEKAMREDLSLEASLRNALGNREFEVYYQPMVSPADRRCIALEALLRWHSPRHGEVSPTRFIPLLEESGLITAVGRWVLQTACRQFRTMIGNGLDGAILAVNVSGHQVNDRGLPDEVRAILATTGLAPSQLELEITESVLVDEAEGAGSILQELAELGVRLAIDDFGTGYSSLSYLRRFPINTLKIDRSFVAEMESGDDALAIVRSVISLANDLDLAVVAEGVESIGQLTLLAGVGCSRAQGFLFSRPLPAADLAKWLEQAVPGFAANGGASGKTERPAAGATIGQAKVKAVKTIFLVDDSTTILLSISSILTKAGYAVEKAASAEEALARFNAGISANLLITDLNMPGMNGIELIGAVRKLPAYRFLPILFLTTESQQAKRQEAKAAGASGWIVKPATADELLSTIKLVIR